MNHWENCQKRFPHRTTLTETEKEHIPIAFSDHFAATDQGQRFLFGLLIDDIFWSTGPAHHWRYLENNELVRIEILTAGFLDKDYIDNLDPIKGTGQYQGKEVQYSTKRNCWTYLNNRTVHFRGTSASETPANSDDDTAKVQEILESTETTVSSAIQKLREISRPASPAVRVGTSHTTAPVQASSLPTPPMSKGKQPVPIPPRTRTPTSRSSAPKPSTSQGPVQAPPPQPAAPQPPPGPPPPN